MKIQTKITEMLNIDLPILGAPMFLVSYPRLVSAVSNFGGIGCFPALNFRTTEELKNGIDEIRSLTSKPIGVNIILHKDHNPDWKKQLDVCLEKKVELYIASLGTPRTLIKEAKATGGKVFCDVTTLKHASLVAKAGCDAIIAVGSGAGGHSGNISLFSLIPYIKKETGLPIVAAGSISNGSQLLAALSLGADAVSIGTRLIATEEAEVDPSYKTMLIDSTPEEIIYTDKVTGIHSNWMKKSLDMHPWILNGEKPPQSLEGDDKRWKNIWSAGHGVAQVSDVISVGELFKKIIEEYKSGLNGLPNLQ
ncbi:MAG: nitronate monooxygenase [Leptospiraceae bacterium]|nr:nitronate monooxygenase [Leptospiraceae bacterium]MCP5496156.1 nitronate monooxygenase [Leptospiraceae bacterium]